MTSIGLQIVTFDDPLGIKRIFDEYSVSDFDCIVILDGRFSGFKGKQEYDNNATELICRNYGRSIISYEKVKGKTEANKRDFAMTRCQALGLDYVVVCDSDETVTLDKSYFLDVEVPIMESTDYGCFGVELDHFGQIGLRPRLFRMSEQPYYIQYPNKKSHASVYSGRTGKEMTTQITQFDFTSKAVKLKHNKRLRSVQRIDAMREYAKIPNH